MNYECHIVPLNKLLLNPKGVEQPLCNDCRAPDCTNPIRDRVIAILGVPKKMRLWVVNNQIRQVVACKGYVGEANAPTVDEISGLPTISSKQDVVANEEIDDGSGAEGQPGY